MSSATSQRDAQKSRQRKGAVRAAKEPGPLGFRRLSFKYYIYILVGVTALLSIYYAYRMSEIQRAKAQNFQDTLNKARGKPPTSTPLTDEEITKNTRDNLQRKIEDLASLLGVQPIALASAIAGIVKPNMPAASASSISSQAKSSDSVLSAFTEGLKDAPADATATPTATETSEGGMAASIISAVKGAGFDDMGMDVD
ncbi:hypothetical protein M408DRAFT_64809 [Serendipita vermifera MAFF 305830]|uniref:Transmembrane protein n=1 Tax=Serendipita vermifera MAFF 305830 TaxID=933852 RepID=A0A0C3BIB9_SERVB|nr:hypothetical protein M408DRAFT_64809 [Serendipita vermifera MAFF 305830]